MPVIASQNNKHSSRGVSLVEVMIALVVLLVVFMGLIQASLLSIEYNVRNEIRDEAVRVASEAMAQSRREFSTLTDTATDCAPLAPVDRTIRNQTIAFSRCRVVKDLDTSASNKQVTVTVTWKYRGEDLSHTINSIVRNS